MISKPPSPLNRDYNRDPNIQAPRRRWFIDHGSTLGHKGTCSLRGGSMIRGAQDEDAHTVFTAANV